MTRDRFVFVAVFVVCGATVSACSSTNGAGATAGAGGNATGVAGTNSTVATAGAQGVATAGATGVASGSSGSGVSAVAGQTASAAGTGAAGESDEDGGTAGALATGGVGGTAGAAGAAGATQGDCTPAGWHDPGTVANPKVVAVAADAGTKGHMFGPTPNIGDYDYLENEFFFTGTSPAYTTRMVVQRPKDPAKYNGTVMLEWYNVSGQIDFAPDWMYSRDYFAREGYVHIAVSAQKVGADYLKTFDSVRYASINHPGDSSANAIFSQAAMAVRSQSELLLGGPCMPVHAVIAIGQSQSAFELANYVDSEQPKAKIIDSFVLHSGLEPMSNNPAVPVFEIFSETEGNSKLTDGPNLVKWVIAGATHNDAFITNEGLKELGPDVGVTTMTMCTSPMNSFPSYRAYDAVFDWVNRWTRKGERPPAGTPYQTTASGSLQMDQYGNVLGGVRLPEIDVPIATYGTQNSAQSASDLASTFVCSLSGSTVPLTAAQLQMLYPTHDDYVNKYTAAADKAVAAGYLLKADYDTGLKDAQSAAVPK